MTITFACPACGKQIRAKDEAAGKSGKCNGCNSVLTVPRENAAAMIARGPDEVFAPQRAAPPPARREQPQPPAAYAPQPQELQQQPQPQIQYVPVPVPYHAPAPVQAVQPNIIVNVAQHASAHATAVAIANARPAYTNGLATAAAVIALLALFFAWIPFLGMLAIPAAVLAIVLAGLALLLALFNRGAGLFRAIAGGAFGLLAIVVAIASTGAAAKSIVEEANKVQAREKNTAAVAPQQRTAAKPASAPLIAPKVAAAVVPAALATEPVTKPTPAPPVDPNAEAQRKFAGALHNGRALVNAGVFPGARKQFQKIIDGAPDTDIAAEAQKELDAIAKK
jgi:hypothetical protein